VQLENTMRVNILSYAALLLALSICPPAEGQTARRKPIYWRVNVAARSLEPTYLEVVDGREIALAPKAADRCVALVDVEFAPTFSDSAPMDKKLEPLADLLDAGLLEYLKGRRPAEGRRPPLPAHNARLLVSTRVRLVVDGREIAPRLTSCPDGPGWSTIPAERIVDLQPGPPPSVLRYARGDKCTALLVGAGRRNTLTFVYVVPRDTKDAQLAFDDLDPQPLTFRPLQWQPDGPAPRDAQSAALLRELLSLTRQAAARDDWLVAWRNASRAAVLAPADALVRRELAAVRPEGAIARVLSLHQEGDEIVASILWMLQPSARPPDACVLLAHFAGNSIRPDDVWRGRSTLTFRDGSKADIGNTGAALTLASPVKPGAGGQITKVKVKLPRPPKMEAGAGMMGAISVFAELSTAEGDAGKALSPPARGTARFDRSQLLPSRRTIFD